MSPFVFTLFLNASVQAADCAGVYESCSSRYVNSVAEYADLDCNNFEERCKGMPGQNMGMTEFLQDCENVRAFVKDFNNRFPSPNEFMAKCGKEGGNCAPEGDKILTAIGPKLLGGPCKNKYFDKSAKRSSVGEELKLALGKTSAPKTIPVIAAPAEEKIHVAYVIERDEILAFHPECLEKEKASGNVFCGRLYKEPHAYEGDKGPIPTELSMKLSAAYRSGLFHRKVPVRIEFKSLAECKSELLKQERAFGNVIAFFNHYALDQEKICAGLIKHDIPPLWHLLHGSVLTNHQTPVTMTGRYETN